jgi:hypothetical protein
MTAAKRTSPMYSSPTPYQIKHTGSLSNIWGDFIVFRNLIPADKRLPTFQDLKGILFDGEIPLPRKVEPAYGRVVAEILARARRLELPRSQLKRLIFLGDTRLLDGTAFQNLCLAGEWPGWAFIGRDDLKASKANQVEGDEYIGQFFISNRWSGLGDFLGYLVDQGVRLDEETALVIDMDKTSVGARGRNDKPIDEARLEGVRLTVADLLGASFNESAFRDVYHTLNQPVYHPFTADNQDYLAYICLMLGTSLFTFEQVVQEVQESSLSSFFEFIQRVQERRAELGSGSLGAIHDQVWAYVQANDPTPFKAFRYNEYFCTAGRFGGAQDEPISQLLTERIVITAEVQEFAAELRQRGALVFGLSDKPDEASFPTAEQVRQGMKPLHQLETLVVGEGYFGEGAVQATSDV